MCVVCTVLFLLGPQEVYLTVLDPAMCIVLFCFYYVSWSVVTQEVYLTVLDPATSYVSCVLFCCYWVLQEVDLTVLDPAMCLVYCSVVTGSARGRLNCPRPSYRSDCSVVIVDLTVLDPATGLVYCSVLGSARGRQTQLQVYPSYVSARGLLNLSCTVLLLLGLQEVDLTVLDPATGLVYCSVVTGSARSARPSYVSCVLFCCLGRKRST